MEVLKVEKPNIKDDSKEEEVKKVKEGLKEHLAKRAEARADSELINDAIFNKMLELVKVDIPKGYYEMELNRSLEDFERQVSGNGMTKTDFFISVGKKEDDIKKEYEENVKKQISFDLIMAKFADVYKDSLNINEDKAKEYANRLYQYQSYLGLSKRPKEEQQEIINHIMKEAENRAVSEAILDYIKEHINITEKDAGRFVANENDLWAGY